MQPLWLPALLLLEDYNGDWKRYFEAVYAAFEQDFVHSKPEFRGKRLGLKRHPEYDGKSATFWHMMSTGEDEAERLPDMRRCERIRWPKPVIGNSTDPVLKVWAEPKGNQRRIFIFLEEEGYLVILDDRGEYILPWTAYFIEYEHQRRKYNKRWQRYGAI